MLRGRIPSDGYGMPTGVTNPVFGGHAGDYVHRLSRATWEPALTVASTRGPEGNFDLVDNVSFLHGKHAFKFGFEYVDILFDQGQGGNIRTPGKAESISRAWRNFS